MLKTAFIRSLLFTLIVIAVVALTACGPEDNADSAVGVNSNKTYHWKMVTTWPPGFPVLQEGAERFAENVKAMSNGRINIKVYAGGELIPALQTFDAVSQGTVEMGHGLSLIHI